MINNLSPYIWHQDFCPAPAHEGDCCCGYAEAKAEAEEIDASREAAAKDAKTETTQESVA